MRQGFDSNTRIQHLPGQTHGGILLRDMGYYPECHEHYMVLRDIDSMRSVYLYDLPEYMSMDGATKKVVVKKGFNTDFATIPRPVWWYIAPNDLRRPATLHDALYDTLRLLYGRDKLTWKELRQFRRVVDDIFYVSMKYTDPQVGPLRRWSAYRSVRAFGGLPLHINPIPVRMREDSPVPFFCKETASC